MAASYHRTDITTRWHFQGAICLAKSSWRYLANAIEAGAARILPSEDTRRKLPVVQTHDHSARMQRRLAATPQRRYYSLRREPDLAQGFDDKIAIGFRQRRHASLHLRHRQIGILLPQRAEAPTGLRLGARKHIGRTQGSVHPDCRRMFDQRTLLPVRRFGIIAGLEMRAADPDQAVECERIMRRQIERDLKTFDRRVGVAPVDVEPSAAAPRPCRSAVNRERLANDEVC